MRLNSKPAKAPPNPFRWFDSSPEVIRLLMQSLWQSVLAVSTQQQQRQAAFAEHVSHRIRMATVDVAVDDRAPKCSVLGNVQGLIKLGNWTDDFMTKPFDRVLDI